VELVIHSGTLRELWVKLQNHTLDVVLSNTHVRRDASNSWQSHLIDEQSVSLVGHKKRAMKPFRLPEDLRATPIVLPSLESSIRTTFDLLMDQTGVRPIIAAEVDDMASASMDSFRFRLKNPSNAVKLVVF
jgi:LysR family transcriptional activator of nhaA